MVSSVWTRAPNYFYSTRTVRPTHSKNASLSAAAVTRLMAPNVSNAGYNKMVSVCSNVIRICTSFKGLLAASCITNVLHGANNSLK